MAGFVVAFIGIAVSQYYDLPVLDSDASVLIGTILALTAALRACECNGLLIGESAGCSTVEGIRERVAAAKGVTRINEFLTMHLGPAEMVVNISVDFSDGITAQEIEATTSALERDIKQAWPVVTRVFIEAQHADAPVRDASGG